MIVMPSNNTGQNVKDLAAKFPHRIGHLHSPDALRRPQFPHFGLDNGVYGAWSNDREWSADAYFKALQYYRKDECQWTVVPDWVADRKTTLSRWIWYSEAIAALGYKLAFAVQDGMTPADIPPGAEVVFVGGSTDWKWQSLPIWTNAFPRVHCARVNTYRLLWMAHNAGCESVDGTGFNRGDPKQWNGLVKYLNESEGKRFSQTEMFPFHEILNSSMPRNETQARNSRSRSAAPSIHFSQTEMFPERFRKAAPSPLISGPG